MDHNKIKTTVGKSTSVVRVILLLLLVLGPAATQVRAQENPKLVREISRQEKPVTLSQAIDIAMANNTDIRRAMLDVDNADQQIRTAWAEVMPDVSSSATYTRNLEIPVNFVPAKFFDPNAPADQLVPLQFGTDNNWQGGFTAEQKIFSGEALVGISSAKLYKAAQTEKLRQTAQEIVTRTREAYYQVLIAEEQVRLQKATIKRLEENLKDNRARHKAGLLDEYDVLRVEVQLSNERPKLTDAEFAVKQAYRALLLQIGLPVDLKVKVQGDLNNFDVQAAATQEPVNKDLKRIDRMTPIQLTDSASVVENAFDLRGDLRVLDVQQQLKDREILAIKSRYLPSVTATYNYQWTAAQPGNPVFFGDSNQRARYQTLALSVNLPLFQGFRRNANLQIAKIEKKNLKEQEYFTERAAKNEILSAEESLRQAFETAEARRKALKQARRGYEIATARLSRGVGSQLDVTNAELQLREAQLNYARMVYNYLTAKARYDQAVGRVPFVDQSNQEINP